MMAIARPAPPRRQPQHGLRAIRLSEPLVRRMWATEASRNVARTVDQAEHDGETLVVESHGRPVAEIRSAALRRAVQDLLGTDVRLMEAG
jgi:antitoxin (DNA-binding transcriptional repressor) of toxin-antitoxin stability system